MNNKSKKVGYMLAFFLGGIGAHAFYYRKYVKGALYFLFCWTAIPVFLGWIDMLFIKKWHNKLEADLLIQENNLKQNQKIDDLAIKNQQDKRSNLFSDGRSHESMAKTSLERKEHKKVKKVTNEAVEEQHVTDSKSRNNSITKPNVVHINTSSIASSKDNFVETNKVEGTTISKTKVDLLASNNTTCSKDQEAIGETAKTSEYSYGEGGNLLSTPNKEQESKNTSHEEIIEEVQTVPSTMEDKTTVSSRIENLLTHIPNINLPKPNEHFYNEEAIILDKYRGIETPKKILKDIEQIKHENSSENKNFYEISFSYNGSKLIKHSLAYANEKGVKSPEVPLHAYWTTFDSLNYEQKKWYFYWRRQVLNGNYLDVDLSYIILFVYELLNYSFNQKAAFNISMMIRLYENYVERLPKVKTYIGSWTADMLQEVDESELLEDWMSSPSEVYVAPLYKQLKEKQNDLARISFTKWKPYIKNYRETIFFTTHKHKIYKTFKQSIPLLQDVYQKQGEQLIDRYFKIQEESTVKYLYSSAVMGRETEKFHIRTKKIQPTACINNEVTALFRLAENVTRLLNGEKRQIKVEESFLPEGFKEMMIGHFTPASNKTTKRFKVVQKAENPEGYGEILRPHQDDMVPEQRPRIEFSSSNIKTFRVETEELISIFDAKSKEEEETFDITNNIETSTLNEVKSYNTNVGTENEQASATHKEHELDNDSNVNVEITKQTSNPTTSDNLFLALKGGGSIDEEKSFIESLTAMEKEFLAQFDNGVYNRNTAHSFLKKKGFMLGMFVSEINEKANEYLGDNFLDFRDEEIIVYEEFEQFNIMLKE